MSKAKQALHVFAANAPLLLVRQDAKPAGIVTESLEWDIYKTLACTCTVGIRSCDL